MPKHHTMRCSCGAEVNGTTLCKQCVRTVDVALTKIAAAYADLELVETGRRGVRYDLPRGKGGTRSIPLPFDNRFAPGGIGDQARQQTHDLIAGWVRHCRDLYGIVGPRQTVSACCVYLQGLLGRIAVAPWADEFKTNILDLEKQLRRVDAGRPEKIYAGECLICLIFNDHVALWAMPDDEWVTCRDCGADYNVDERRKRMIDALEYEWLTAAKIADQAAYLRHISDRNWARKKINRWHADGFLKAADVDHHGEPVFPFGDVCRLLIAAQTRRQRTA